MKIALVGWGVETKSALKYFGPDHEYLIVNEEPRDDFPPMSDTVKLQFLRQLRQPGITSNASDLTYLDGIDKCDKIIYSVTSVKNLEERFGDDSSFWKKAITVQHIFFEEYPSQNIIGVTGSKGKGTTSTLIYEMLRAAQLPVHLGGNIGVSVLDILPDIKPDDWVVLELTNFQLYRFPYSPHIAVCLMITKEHQDWHSDMEEYIAAKANLFAHQKKDDIAIYFASNHYSQQIAGHSKGAKIPYFDTPGAVAKDEGLIVVGEPETEIITTEEVKLIGEHNLENICAAVTAVWQISQNVEAIRQVLTTFSGLEHRLEFVRELDDVRYFDDSFGTTPETTMVALKSFVEPKILILGGHDKGLPFDNLVKELIDERVRKVILIGDLAPKLEELLVSEGYTDIIIGLTDMKQIVDAARQAAEPGDVVLLSTGSSSFGLFKDYKDRGEQFKQAVRALA